MKRAHDLYGLCALCNFGGEKMLKSCKYCGKIHEVKFDCGFKKKPAKKITYVDKFRWSKKWKVKAEEIKRRDLYMCQVCSRKRYATERQYNTENLSVHHIIPLATDFDYRLDDDYLITLCSRHHSMAEDGDIPAQELIEIVAEQEQAAV